MDPVQDQLWQYCFVQTVNLHYSAGTNSHSVIITKDAPYEGLDTEFPYGNPFTNTTITSNDSPGGPIPEDGYLQYSADFTTWLMCRPLRTNGIWVPIKSISWSIVISSTWVKGAIEPTVNKGSSLNVHGAERAPVGFANQDLPYLYTAYYFGDATRFPTWTSIVTSASTIHEKK